MKNYLVKTLMVSLPRPITETIIIELPDNAIPVGVEVRPLGMPEGLFLHHLIPCDEKGNPIEDVITPNVYEVAWNKLYELFGELSDQEALDKMDGVLCGTKTLMLNEAERRGGRSIEEELGVNHKGQFCWIDNKVFCQEGWCSECKIYSDWKEK